MSRFVIAGLIGAFLVLIVKSTYGLKCFDCTTVPGLQDEREHCINSVKDNCNMCRIYRRYLSNGTMHRVGRKCQSKKDLEDDPDCIWFRDESVDFNGGMSWCDCHTDLCNWNHSDESVTPQFSLTTPVYGLKCYECSVREWHDEYARCHANRVRGRTRLGKNCSVCTIRRAYYTDGTRYLMKKDCYTEDELVDGTGCIWRPEADINSNQAGWSHCYCYDDVCNWNYSDDSVRPTFPYIRTPFPQLAATMAPPGPHGSSQAELCASTFGIAIGVVVQFIAM